MTNDEFYEVLNDKLIGRKFDDLFKEIVLILVKTSDNPDKMKKIILEHFGIKDD